VLRLYVLIGTAILLGFVLNQNLHVLASSVKSGIFVSPSCMSAMTSCFFVVIQYPSKYDSCHQASLLSLPICRMSSGFVAIRHLASCVVSPPYLTRHLASLLALPTCHPSSGFIVSPPYLSPLIWLHC
jgi:hypothetical protein